VLMILLARTTLEQLEVQLSRQWFPIKRPWKRWKHVGWFDCAFCSSFAVHHKSFVDYLLVVMLPFL
jgi:hypothetical protein